MKLTKALIFWAGLALALIFTQKLAIFFSKLIVDLITQQ